MPKKKNLIQRVETWRYDLPLHCPFCGAKAIDPESETSPLANLCKHVLFVAHDEAFEIRSDKFNSLMGIEGIEDDDIELGEKGYDGFTDQVVLADSIKFAIYTPAPSFFGAYIGFAPSEDE
jgi:hypothetical protein